jgi:FixJ family two-component response regulator
VPPSPETPCVYIVEDDVDQRDGPVLLLKWAGFAVRSYGSAETFLAEHTPNLTGCVLSDVRLSGMNGVGLVMR